MRITTITCDHCKKEITDGDIHDVKIFVGEMRGYATPLKSAEWCRACLISVLGVTWKSGDPEVKPPDQPPTIEDMIREIAGEAAIEAVENR